MSDRRKDIELEALKKALSHAWGIETLLYANFQAAEDDAVIRLANNWSCIQTYYIYYHATQALMIAKGHPRPESHPKTQKAFVNLWADRNIELGPWTFVYGGIGPKNQPSDLSIDASIHPWSRCESTSCWSLAAKALETTRREFHEEAIHDARRKKKQDRARTWDTEESNRLALGRKPRKKPDLPFPILKPEEKELLARNLRSYSIFDYLYRLRIKTNYIDSDMFVDGPEDDQQSRRLATYLCELSSSALLLTELSLIHLWGRSEFLTFRTQWLQSRKKASVVEQAFSRAEILASHRPQ